MAKKRIFLNFIFAGLLVASACSTTKEEDGPPLFPPADMPSIQGQDLPQDSGTSGQVEAQSAPRARVGVWIQASGLDALTALGFMQELAKQGYSFDKVMGTGWGCWVALSWGVQNNSNQAEWQAFKWDSWNILGRRGNSLLSRIRIARRSSEDFAADLSKILAPKEYSQLRGDVDCPLLSMKGSNMGTFTSSHSLGVARSLWEQLQTPSLMGEEVSRNLEDDDLNWVSGVAAESPQAAELDAFSRINKEADGTSASISHWIVLQTASEKRQPAEQQWINTIQAQVRRRLSHDTVTPESRLVFHIRLNDPKDTMDMSQQFEARRRYLLRGRELARQFLQSAKVDNIR